MFFGPAIYIGSSNVITSKPVPDNLLALIEKYKITSFFAPPTVWIALLRSPLFDPNKLAHLAKGYYVASIMPVEVLKELASRLPKVRLWNLYGQTEIAPLATIDEEGYISVVDRKKDMIKTGGENVASREVEEMIYRLSAVNEVAMIGLPDPKWVEAVTAVIVLKTGQSLTEAEVMAHCNQHMASFKSPKRVVFAEALPKNPSGKLLKRELRTQYA